MLDRKNYAPLKLKPAYKNYIWGGTNLKTDYHKHSDLDIIAESWELSTHKDGQSSIDNVTLKEYLQENYEFLGDSVKDNDIPILIKLIDAKERLSIQVHPNDEYAHLHENDNGKTEMWIILDCKPNSFLYYGVNQELTKDEFKQRIIDNTILDVLNQQEVKKGDVYFIEPGTIHAIGAGIVLLEIQQKSNVTYRLYDYDRKDALGNKRELHLDKALEVCNLKPQAVNVEPTLTLCNTKDFKLDCLKNCEYFNVYRYDVYEQVTFSLSTQLFHIMTVIEGYGKLHFDQTVMEITKGDTILVPAVAKEVKVIGQCSFVLSSI